MSKVVWQLVRQLVYTMFTSNNQAKFGNTSKSVKIL